jgi:hypothetical protein
MKILEENDINAIAFKGFTLLKFKWRYSFIGDIDTNILKNKFLFIILFSFVKFFKK